MLSGKTTPLGRVRPRFPGPGGQPCTADTWPEGFHPLNRHRGHPFTPLRPPPPPAVLPLCSWPLTPTTLWPPKSLQLQPRPSCSKPPLTASSGPSCCAVRFKCAQLSTPMSPLNTVYTDCLCTPPPGISPRPPDLCLQPPARPLTGVQSPHIQHTQLLSPPHPYSHLKAAPPPQPGSLLPGEPIICLDAQACSQESPRPPERLHDSLIIHLTDPIFSGSLKTTLPSTPSASSPAHAPIISCLSQSNKSSGLFYIQQHKVHSPEMVVQTVQRWKPVPDVPSTRGRHCGARASGQSPDAPTGSQEGAPPLPPGNMPAFCHKPHSSCSARRLSSQDTFSVWTAPQSSQGTSRKNASRVRTRALGQSGSVRAQQSRPPFGCARKPRKVPHLPLLDGSVSPAEDTPYLSLYLTCQVHHLAMRRHKVWD